MAAPLALSAQQAKQFRFPVAAGATISITNQYGPVTLHAAPGNEVAVTATAHSSKVSVDESHGPRRVDVVSRLQPGTVASEGLVEYEVAVPAGATVSVHASTGPVRVDKVTGDLTLESDAGTVEVRNLNNSHLHVHTVQGAITLVDLRTSHVDASSVGGAVSLSNVSGPKVSADSNSGVIDFRGDCSGGGDYTLSTHSGDITVTLPGSASVDLSARSVSGAVQNDFPFQPAANSAPAQPQPHAFAGRANSAAAAVRLRSFSGTIRVKKQ